MTLRTGLTELPEMAGISTVHSAQSEFALDKRADCFNDLFGLTVCRHG